jgi:hypothetical protein
MGFGLVIGIIEHLQIVSIHKKLKMKKRHFKESFKSLEDFPRMVSCLKERMGAKLRNRSLVSMRFSEQSTASCCQHCSMLIQRLPGHVFFDVQVGPRAVIHTPK